MRTEEKSHVKNSIGRLIFVVLSFLIQVSWFVALFMWLNNYSTVINLISSVVALVVVLRVYAKQGNVAFKLPWIILMLVMPLLGLCLYLLFGHRWATGKMRARFEKIEAAYQEELRQEPKVMEELEQQDFGVANQCRYLYKYSKYPVYRNTDVVFYSQASDGLEAQLEELKKAEHFIFMEYHAIQETNAFGRLKEVLADRAAHGVEVRVLYDDVGSIGFIDPGFIKRMEAVGVQCRMFNPVKPIMNIFMNNRDHRKITVIDNKVGFTGGYNLADEYFNITHPYGHWKDTGIKLTGDAVESLTAMFLQMWNAMKETDTDHAKYMAKFDYRASEQGFVNPYADSPLDGEYVGENVYLNLIKHAKHYLYVATPYLIISDEMNRELCLAAQRGVDVRVITPGIPDKKVVYRITRSYYNGLAKRGVKIYEYTPGFIHEKQVLCDGEVATVGTINFDYRSLYHHFENGVLMYGCSCIEDIRKDFMDTFALCRDVTEQYRSGRKAFLRISQCILRLFAPLL
ncbi:MAG: cardiolipin synthase [Clostridium sp.]|nr:cardiolipin synthase [Acetatifactor muris]MCM1525759.1 cardiolipin synthase [Bacteroides sp.]MCM1564087.1 cardiolipin synthase [Clostridium sp.]